MNVLFVIALIAALVTRHPIIIAVAVILMIIIIVLKVRRKGRRVPVKHKPPQKKAQTTPAGMGALIEFPKGEDAIGYFRDGAVYSKFQNQLGSYKPFGENYHVEYDKKVIGCLCRTGTGILVFIYRSYRDGYPSDSEKVAEVFTGTGHEFIFPDNTELEKTVIYSGDPIGAAAAYLVLYHGYGRHDSQIRQQFQN
jgi:hypothetical protein